MRPSHWSWLGAVCLLAAACGPSQGGTDPGSDPDGGVQQSPDAGVKIETRTLTGKDEEVFWAPDGTKTTAPADTTRTFIEVQTPNEQGGWDKFPGLANADGTYSIQVPKNAGSYWLRVFDAMNLVDTYVWTSGDAPDLSHEQIGRADQLISHDRKTAVTFHIDGLDTWKDFDELEMASPTAGMSKGTVPTYYATNQPVNGDTKLDGLRLTWSGLPLLSEANGDTLQLVQLHNFRDPSDTVTYHSPIKTVTLTNVTLTNGENTDVTGTFDDPPAFDYALEWKRTAFAELAGDVYPELGPPTFYSFFVHAVPGGATHGRPYPKEMRIIDEAFLPQDSNDLSLTLPARNPYPESWLINGFNAEFQIPIDMEPGIGTALSADVGYVSQERPSAANPVVPMISPARDLKLDGQSIVGQPISGVSAAPELSWTAPRIGTATSWEIHLQRGLIIRDPPVVPGGIPQVHLNLFDVAVLRVPGEVTKVKLPAELLEEGETYILNVRAGHREGQDVAHAPFKQSLPYGWADTWSTFFKR